MVKAPMPRVHQVPECGWSDLCVPMTPRDDDSDCAEFDMEAIPMKPSASRHRRCNEPTLDRRDVVLLHQR